MTNRLKNTSVTVLGSARSGLSAARLLAGAGARVFVSDHSAVADSVRTAVAETGAEAEFGGHTDRALDADMVVVSPGVPSDAPTVKAALAMRIPVISEIEAASWFCRAPIVAVTGSNGKTTTTALIGHLLRASGRRTWVAGNIGVPFSDIAPLTAPGDAVVLEVSSFQLDHVDRFRPHVSVLLNITPDHLDRYGHDIEAYARSKMRIAARQQPDDAMVYNYDDSRLRDFASRLAEERSPRKLAFSTQSPVSEGAFVRDGQMIYRAHDQEEELMQAERLALRGRHNLYNSLAAAVAARVMEVRSDVVRESLMTFEGVPHRLEPVRDLEGVRYVNDSKATNVNAVWYALESFREPIILIAGGRDKGNDYAPLRPLVESHVRAVIAIGESADKVMSELGSATEQSVKAESMDEAVAIAHHLARTGEVVLLSPACASFDMFDNYEHRGDLFRRAVANL